MNDAEIHHQDIKDLLSIARHALQTPLGAIRQIAGLIFYEMEGEAKARFKSDFKTLEDAIGQLNSMLNTLWQMLEVDSRYSKRESVDLRVVIQRAQTRALTVNIGNVATDIPDDLPLITVNAEALEEAICIVLTRVIPFRDGTMPSLSVEHSKNALLIAIRNTLDGDLTAPISIREFLRQRENLSLDLLLVQRLVQGHNGTVSIMGKADLDQFCVCLSLPELALLELNRSK